MTPNSLPHLPRRQRSWPYLHAVVAQLAVFCGAADALAQPDLSWIDRTAIAGREILVHAERGTRPLTVEIKLASEVDAPPTAIWDVLTACEIAPEFVPNVQSCRRLERLDEGRADLFVQVIKPVFFLPSFEHVFRLDYTPHTRIDVHRVSGPIELMEGSWWLVPQENGRILLIHELALNPGFPIPRFLVRAALKRDLPRVMAAVRERAEAAR